MKYQSFKKSLATFSFLAMIMVFGMSAVAQDAETLIVTSSNTRGWSTADTRTGGAVDFITDLDPASPAPSGALHLTTNATTTAKAQYMHEAANVPIAQVTDLSYWTKQLSGPAHADPSYQLVLCLGGTETPTILNPSGCIGFTTMVFEPYQNNGLAPPSPVIVPNVWQLWDVDAGEMWSSRTYNNNVGCAVVNGGGGPPFYTLAGLRISCPSAVAVGFGVNIGSNNPSYNVEADLVKFNLTTYDFQVFSTPETMEDCKKGGWSTFNPPTGPFKNQGQCVSSTVPQ